MNFIVEFFSGTEINKIFADAHKDRLFWTVWSERHVAIRWTSFYNINILRNILRNSYFIQNIKNFFFHNKINFIFI